MRLMLFLSTWLKIRYLCLPDILEPDTFEFYWYEADICHQGDFGVCQLECVCDVSENDPPTCKSEYS